MVAWLAGPGAADVNGQVFVVFGGRVHLMRGWDMVGEVEQDHRWTVEELDRPQGRAVRRAPAGDPEDGFRAVRREQDMALTELAGKELGSQTVVIEPGPVQAFARAVTDASAGVHDR